VGENGAGTINLAQFALEVGVAEAHIADAAFGEDFDGSLVDLACGRDTKGLCRLLDVEQKGILAAGGIDGFGGSVVDLHGVSCEAIVLLKLGVHDVQRLAQLGGAAIQRLLKQVAGTLELVTAIVRDKLGQVRVPDLKGDGVLERVNASLVHFESLLKQPKVK